MQFENTIWLIVGLIVSVGLGCAFYASQKGRVAALSKFASNQLLATLTESVSPGRKRLKQALLILAVFSVFVALARPQVGFRWEEAKRKGIDIMLAVDTSKSMLARDVAPNRLERSKLGIMDFVQELGGDRVGLIPFAGDAFLLTPLTLDYGGFPRVASSRGHPHHPTGWVEYRGRYSGGRPGICGRCEAKNPGAHH